ncbi:metalloregulator ArsR/SmtB family transcription factor [Paracoccus sp. S3-43]|uniref:ArsR/SmtB family transcription factor n=1 Tax=Paracoccus sp. S3-43 TaxID=3030011 RepID=UPI0023AFC84C|nr:metalloregulator ArsR/SmtB family transcription factor [Paracoccus sp. S3-43]WEF25128.1 metalloregulator ArsR/SmtB family transcription factor [Paracoccus sp. S3-43]
MNEPEALAAFAAMSQETRLRVVRLLVQAGPEGMAAGAIGVALGGATTSRLSFHLTHLEHAGLIRSRREGRFIIYSAVFPTLAGLIEFLMRDCCDGHPEVCAPVAAALSCSCEPQKDVLHG